MVKIMGRSWEDHGDFCWWMRPGMVMKKKLRRSWGDHGEIMEFFVGPIHYEEY